MQNAQIAQAMITGPVILGYEAYYNRPLDAPIKHTIRARAAYAAYEAERKDASKTDAALKAINEYIKKYPGVLGTFTAEELMGMGYLAARQKHIPHTEDSVRASVYDMELVEKELKGNTGVLSSRDDKDKKKDETSPDFSQPQLQPRPRPKPKPRPKPTPKPMEIDTDPDSGSKSGSGSGSDSDSSAKKRKKEEEEEVVSPHSDQESHGSEESPSSSEKDESDHENEESHTDKKKKHAFLNFPPDTFEPARFTGDHDATGMDHLKRRAKLRGAVAALMDAPDPLMLYTAELVEEQRSGATGDPVLLLKNLMLRNKINIGSLGKLWALCESECTNNRPDGTCATRRCKARKDGGLEREVLLKVLLAENLSMGSGLDEGDVKENLVDQYTTSLAASEALICVLATELVVGNRCPNLPILYAALKCNTTGPVVDMIADPELHRTELKGRYYNLGKAWVDAYKGVTNTKSGTEARQKAPLYVQELLDHRRDKSDNRTVAWASRAVDIACVLLLSECPDGGTLAGFIRDIEAKKITPDLIMSMHLQPIMGIIAMHRYFNVMLAELNLESVMRHVVYPNIRDESNFAFIYEIGNDPSVKNSVVVPLAGSVFTLTDFTDAKLEKYGFNKPNNKNRRPFITTARGDRTIMSAAQSFSRQLVEALKHKKVPESHYEKVRQFANVQRAFTDPVHAIQELYAHELYALTSKPASGTYPVETQKYNGKYEIVAAFDMVSGFQPTIKALEDFVPEVNQRVY